MASSSKTLLTVKTDKKLKKEAQKVAEELGLPLSTFINMTLKQLVRQKEICFTEGYTPNAQTIKDLIQAEKEFARGEYEGPFTIEELMKKWKLK